MRVDEGFQKFGIHKFAYTLSYVTFTGNIFVEVKRKINIKRLTLLLLIRKYIIKQSKLMSLESNLYMGQLDQICTEVNIIRP